MADTFFDNPPILRGKEAEQLQQLYSYLSAMSQQLNSALMTISIEQLTPETQTVILEGTEKQQLAQKSALKEMIVKSAEIVRTQMDEIRTTLETQVEAVSEQFGQINTQLTNEVNLTAEGLQQAISYIETLQQAGETSAEFQARYTSYIHVGVIRYDNGVPISGVAIGKDVTNPDGTVNPNKKLATFTADRLSFYTAGTEIAYFSNNTFHIENGEVTKSFKMGNHTWTKLSDDSLALLAGS